ncbi:alpha/beta hydrolase-fold protein [Mucilaginibacter sp. dw_454]|uniref:alpha/beta hydrolase n=1 Tax=Mucilaginibacter sp. dw_454 TaxID=2720079 RepID=UPI001BD60EC2|nr:alpha/beta hydrolase-fold protein [Mucilaginibacter sp. dw_454]
MNRPLLTILLFFIANFTYAQHTPITLGETVQLYSKELGETRRLNIYLPEGYHSGDTTRYSVIYLLDGGLDEDFIHVTGLVQFDSFPWIKRVPKSIVVGIVNVDRLRDFTYPTSVKKEKTTYPKAGHSGNFIAFLEKELQPYIQKNYPVNKQKTLIGESLGGLLATEILLKNPPLFDHYLIISPSLWWDNGSLLSLKAASIQKPIRVYIGVGKEGLSPSEQPHIMEVDANLLAEKLKNLPGKNVAIYFDYLPQEDHATIGHPAIFNAFKWLYQ